MYQIMVSGASRGQSARAGAEAAYTLGQEIASRGHIVLTGATTGLPHEAARGAKQAKGKSVGISPAASYLEHVKKYRLPTDAYDVIIYSGLHYVGRDLLLVQSADAVVSIGGRVGTWHEFTVAFETNTPLAVLDIGDGVSVELKKLLEAAGRWRKDLLFESDPAVLVRKLLKQLDDRIGPARALS
ncbi:LOG family protein [Candidatus Microgenomates bacterium]|nr:LOG family protein [Candidatus Microgenomates bacterium]